MTKRNLTLGNASGKLGSVVYMRRRGQQVARVLIPSPRDPMSQRQGVARAIFANYVNVWRLLSPYIGATWRNVSRYGNPANAFFKQNVGRIPTATKGMSRDGYIYPNLGLTTYGSLSVAWQYEYVSVSAPTAPDERADAIAWRGNAFGASPGTIGGVSSALMSANTGLQSGDIVHILLLAFSSDLGFTPEGVTAMRPRIVHCELTIDAADNRAVEDVLPFVAFQMLPAVANYQQIALRPSNSFYSSTTTAENLNVALVSWVERPSVIGVSRFTRSQFALSGDTLNSLRALSIYGNRSQVYGDTFRNV